MYSFKMVQVYNIGPRKIAMTWVDERFLDISKCNVYCLIKDYDHMCWKHDYNELINFYNQLSKFQNK
jgi:hypothetical protein